MIKVNINVLLAQRGMSVSEFAKAVDLSPANVAVLKNGRAKAIRFSTLERICATLNCTVADVLEYVQDEPEKETPSKLLIRVVGAAIFKDGHMLCARRGPGRSLAGFWEFPGGKIEPNETPQEALRREIAEELHCSVHVCKEIVTSEYHYDFGTVRLSVFHCTLDNSEPQRTEHAELRWLLPSQLHSLEWTPADEEAVRIIAAEAHR